jgi:hypothetical protein
MKQFAEIFFASGALGYKDCIRASLTCKTAHNVFKEWEGYIIKNDANDLVAKNVPSNSEKTRTVKDIYRNPEKLFNVYDKVLLNVPCQEHDDLVDQLFHKSIDVVNVIIDALNISYHTTFNRYHTLITLLIKLLEYHLIITNVELSSIKAKQYLRIVDATYFVLEHDMLPVATSTVILILKAYSKSKEQVHIGPNGGIYRVINGKKKYIR